MQKKKHTYAVAILVEGQGAMPCVQVHSYDRALAKARGELHFVPFVLEQTFKHKQISVKLLIIKGKESLKEYPLTCVGEPPAVFIMAQQTAKAVLELVQVHL